jgi:uncharacterized membrane protein YcaP (DUF421 family)
MWNWTFSMNWQSMLALGVPVLEKVIRPILVYLFLVGGLRMAGKRSLASLNSFDLVVLLSISNTVQNAIIGDDNSLTGGLIGAATLLCMNYVVVRFFFEHPALEELVEGHSTVLIEDGVPLEANLHKELISKTELSSAAHRQGFRSLDEVDRAELEPGGVLAFFGKQPTPEEARTEELILRLDRLADQLNHLEMAVGQRQLG